MRHAAALLARLHLGQASHHPKNSSARTTPLGRSSATSPGVSSSRSATILNASRSASRPTNAIVLDTPGTTTPRPSGRKMSDPDVTPRPHKFNDPPPASPIVTTGEPGIVQPEKAFRGYPWVPYNAVTRLPAPRTIPRNALQLQGLAHEDSLVKLPRTFLGESVEDLYGNDAGQTLQAFQLKRRQKGAPNTIDDYIEYARIGESNRHGLAEADPWLESLLVVKQRFADMDEIVICLTRAQTIYPTLRPLIDDATEAIDALKEQTIEFYRDAYSKWWACVPSPPKIPIQALKISRAVCEGKHGSAEAAASFLIGLIPRIDTERESFCDVGHPSPGPSFIPRRKRVRFGPRTDLSRCRTDDMLDNKPLRKAPREYTRYGNEVHTGLPTI